VAPQPQAITLEIGVQLTVGPENADLVLVTVHLAAAVERRAAHRSGGAATETDRQTGVQLDLGAGRA
jgi:hypothetical protein